jgi:hypothetical protein
LRKFAILAQSYIGTLFAVGSRCTFGQVHFWAGRFFGALVAMNQQSLRVKECDKGNHPDFSLEFTYKKAESESLS